MLQLKLIVIDAIPDDDPAIFWTSMARVHQVYGIAGSPVAQGSTPQDSMANLRAFFRAAVTDTNKLLEDHDTDAKRLELVLVRLKQLFRISMDYFSFDKLQ
jgi:hypothetical protein